MTRAIIDQRRSPRPPPGRKVRATSSPPDEQTDAARRARLIEAAEHLFMKTGYHAASMDEIARLAGMSKKTVYRVFPTKEALFGALIAAQLEPVRVEIEEEDNRPIDVRLTDLMHRIARLALAPKQIGIARLVIAEAKRSPEMARAFRRNGPDQGRKAMERWVERQVAKGLLKVERAEEAVRFLCGVVICDLHFDQMLGGARPTRAAIEARIAWGVTCFLRMYGTGWTESKQPE